MTIVDPTLAGPHIPKAQLLYQGDLEVEVHGYKQRYPIEVWQVCNGMVFPIVTQVNANTSLTNASEHVAEAIDTRWPRVQRIIEFWPDGFYRDDAFAYSNRRGGHHRIDRDDLATMGLIIPNNR